ncbi:MAG: hypothetical protein OHK0052_06770 [Anaerolineales bacterium]
MQISVKKIHLSILLLLLLLTAACSTNNAPTPTPTRIPPASIVIPMPQNGRATVSGFLISTHNNQPLQDVVVRLAEVYYPNNDPTNKEDGIYTLDNAFSPSAITDPDGRFIFENIEPRDYVIFIGDISVKYTIINTEDNKPRVWNVKPDKITDFGEILTDF